MERWLWKIIRSSRKTRQKNEWIYIYRCFTKFLCPFLASILVTFQTWPHTAQSTEGVWIGRTDVLCFGEAVGAVCCRGQLKCDGTRTETRFRLSAKRMSPFISAGSSVQSTTGSRGVLVSGSNAGYTMFWGSVKSTGDPLHSPVFPSLPLPCVTVCHHISTGLYLWGEMITPYTVLYT